jgi:REP element-mobilizing transposase RayT
LTEESDVRRRKAQRLPDFDYSSAGAYFVTICVKGRNAVLGEVIEEEVHLSAIGTLAENAWHDLPNHYGSIQLDEFIVMPNHIHGLLWILDSEASQDAVGAGLKPALTKHGLSEVIRGFKTYSARTINSQEQTSGPFWQRGFFEHIIRDQSDLENHRAYIRNNPLKWALDEYFA